MKKNSLTVQDGNTKEKFMLRILLTIMQDPKQDLDPDTDPKKNHSGL